MQQVSQNRPKGVAAFLTNRKVVPYVFVAPFVIYFLLIYLYPTISTILMSFQRIDGPTVSKWIGISNYQKLFSRNFIQALETSSRYALWDVIVSSEAGDEIKNLESFIIALVILALSAIWIFIIKRRKRDAV